MPWYSPIVFTVAISAVYPWFLKRWVVDDKGRLARLFFQYILCLALAGLVLLAVNMKLGVAIRDVPPGLLALGLANGLAVYWQWRAVEVHLAKFSLLAFWADILAVLLGYISLGEATYLNRWLVTGLIFTAIATIGLAVWARRNRPKEENPGKPPPKFFRFVFGYATISGLTSFFQRYFALGGVSQPVWLLGWYAGSLAAVVILVSWLKKRRAKIEVRETAVFSISRRNFLITAGSSLFVFANAWTGYWSAQVAPITVTTPIFFTAALVVPTLIGLYVFGERKDLSRAEAAFMFIAACGGLLVAYGYHVSR